MAHAVGSTVGGPGDDHATVAVTDQDRVAQIFVLQQGDDVVDVAVEVDTGAKQVRALCQTRQRRGVYLVPVVS
jgi:hypothetical protein